MKKILVVLMAVALILPNLRASALTVSAKAAVLINGENGEVIFAKNADQRLSMASTTKIMTALLLCEYGNFEKEITVTAPMLRVEGSSMGLLAGDRVTLHDLLYGLMLASGNDAANVIAFEIGGSAEGFVDIMNRKAVELGLSNTHFETPSGLDGETHYTTAYELAILTQYAMKNSEFRKAVSCKTATLCYGNPPYKRTLTNHNKMLVRYEGAVGVKTGFTKKSGRCLVTAAERDGKFVIAVTLNAPNDWQDHQCLLDYGFSSIKQTHFSPRIGSYTLPVISGIGDSVSVDIEPLTINSLDTADITCQIYLPSFVYAPVKKGEKLGKAIYFQNGEIIAEKPLLAKNEIHVEEYEQSAIDTIFENFKYIFNNI